MAFFLFFSKVVKKSWSPKGASPSEEKGSFRAKRGMILFWLMSGDF
jgi:hypothetical protein